MKKQIGLFASLFAMLIASLPLSAEEMHILTFAHDGQITWSNTLVGVTCRVERASALAPLAESNWFEHTSTYVTSALASAEISVDGESGFFRIARDMTLRDDLLAYFPFDGDPDDHSGNGYTGIVSGATLTTDRHGSPDSAYLFNGPDDYLYATVGTNVQPTEAISLCCFVFSNDRSLGRFSRIIRKCAHNQNGYMLSWSQPTGGDGVAEVRLDGPNSVHLGVANTGLTGSWNHIAATYSEATSSAFFYVDGVEVNSMTNRPYQLIHSGDRLYIGSFLGGASGQNEWFPGSVDEVRIYGRVLSSNEVWRLSQE